ncbi:MAG: BNR-4 repeat-containing protein [Lentisphaerae bacterium]|nr:BNR-4 repeat-containing protein [Lentisphaerota bacterium]
MPTQNRKTDGYCGIWYMNEPVSNEYRYKYSGGLGTFPANHSPFAVYCAEVEKTFFCYGGARPGYHLRAALRQDGFDTLDRPDSLLHMVGFYDHRSGLVSRPALVLDKQTMDAHDNPVMSVDQEGHIWVFSTAHGTLRPSFIHRSVRPYDIGLFERVNAVQQEESGAVPFDNFSYLQVAPVRRRGFVAFLTRYRAPDVRAIGFISSRDGVRWTAWQPLAAIEKGHYQVSVVGEEKAGVAFNYHPLDGGLNSRTNVYYLETSDWGATWHTADGRRIDVPIMTKNTPALARDYEREGLKVYLNDVAFDAHRRPVILYVTSRGFAPGPENGPRAWHTAAWLGGRWEIQDITTSDSNYDMGSLWLGDGGPWRMIGPTERGPQPFNPGGEVALWESAGPGAAWRQVRQLTSGSRYNHTYVRRPLHAHPDFYAFWADGHGRQPSPSRLYFCDRAGRVKMLPQRMTKEFAEPENVMPHEG